MDSVFLTKNYCTQFFTRFSPNLLLSNCRNNCNIIINTTTPAHILRNATLFNMTFKEIRLSPVFWRCHTAVYTNTIMYIMITLLFQHSILFWLDLYFSYCPPRLHPTHIILFSQFYFLTFSLLSFLVIPFPKYLSKKCGSVRGRFLRVWFG